MSKINLDELKTLAAKASPGKWTAIKITDPNDPQPLREEDLVAGIYGVFLDPVVKGSNVALIIAMHAALPSMIEEIESLRACIEELKRMDVFPSVPQSHINPEYPIDLCNEWRTLRDGLIKKWGV